MKNNCLLLPTQDAMTSSMSDFLKFAEQFRGIPGSVCFGSMWCRVLSIHVVTRPVRVQFVCITLEIFRYIIAAMDATVYPPNAAYVKNACQVLANVCSMSQVACGFLQLPLHQKQTSELALLKRRRLISEALIAHSLTSRNEIVLLYEKPQSSGKDGRAMSQQSLLTLNKAYDNSPWLESAAVTNGRIEGCPLIKCADMIGFDESTKPSASARVEQSLSLSCEMTSV